MFDYWLKIIPSIVAGFSVSVSVYTLTLLFSLPLGLALAMVARTNNKVAVRAVSIFTWILRGTPLLLQLYITMYAVPLIIPMRMNRFFAGTFTFVINYAAYFTEIFRSGLAIIPLGQWQAGQVLGLTKPQIFFHIIVPQMFRNVLLPLVNEAITLVKDTSLLAAIALAEMLRNAKEIIGRDLRMDALVIAGLIYLLFSYLVVMIGKQLEKKYLNQV